MQLLSSAKAAACAAGAVQPAAHGLLVQQAMGACVNHLAAGLQGAVLQATPQAWKPLGAPGLGPVAQAAADYAFAVKAVPASLQAV